MHVYAWDVSHPIPEAAILGEHEMFIFADRRGMDSRFHGNDAGLLIVIPVKTGIQKKLNITKNLF